MKKALQLASVASMIDQFNIPNIQILQSLGYQVDIVADFSNPGNITENRTKELRKQLEQMEVRVFDVPIPRRLNAKSILLAYKRVKNIIKFENYSLIHCHSPIGGVICRLAARNARKQGTCVIYTAHGFHFHKGAPKLNWLVYYPVEKICSHFTDKLITINKEDYKLAKKKMKAKEICYVPGVGVDISKFKNVKVDRNAKRREIGVPEDCFLLLSVGELNENKNHQIIIKALAKLNNPKIHYAIAGIGDKKDYLIEMSKMLGINERVHLLGFRNDIPELNYISDVFCFPSFREGLGIASIEAMTCGLPLITSNIHGINDYSQNGVTGYKTSPTNADGFADAIQELIDDPKLRRKIALYNTNFAEKYDINQINCIMKKIYDF